MSDIGAVKKIKRSIHMSVAVCGELDQAEITQGVMPCDENIVIGIKYRIGGCGFHGNFAVIMVTETAMKGGIQHTCMGITGSKDQIPGIFSYEDDVANDDDIAKAINGHPNSFHLLYLKSKVFGNQTLMTKAAVQGAIGVKTGNKEFG